MKRKQWAVLALACVCALMGGCGNTKKDSEQAGNGQAITDTVPAITTEFSDSAGLPQFKEPADTDEVALIVTDCGNILVRFCPEGAPKAVENFVTHAKEKYYDGTVFHRTIEDFMIQGGDPEGTGMGGESIWGEGFGVEATDNLFHFRGALAMAQSSLPNSIGSQFYIVQAGEIPAPYLDMMRAGAFDNGVQGYSYPASAIDRYASLGGYPWLDQGYTVFGQVLGGMEAVDKIAAGAVTDQNGTAAKPVKMERIVVMTYAEAKEHAGK